MPVNFLNLPGLRVLDFKETDREHHVKAEPVAFSRMCPHCGQSHGTIGHGKLPLFVRDLPNLGKRLMIHVDAPRLRCKPCNKTFTATIPDIDENRLMTARLVVWIGRQALDYTFAALAEQVGVDEKTIRNIFGEYAAGLQAKFKRETPTVLGMDEIHLGRYRGVITNIGDHTVVDMLPDRYKTSVVAFLRSLEHPERITHAAVDMYRPYREAIQEVLPHVTIVADRYHVARMGNESLERVRRKMKDSLPPKVNLGLKHDRKLLLMRRGTLNDQQHLLVTGWLNSFPLLKAAYDLKERYYDIWNVETAEEALAEYLRWQDSIPPELAKAFRPIPVAWKTWRKYILNFFDDKRITNAFTESFNSKIRKAYRNGHGYSFEVLRAKILFSDALQKRIRVAEQVKVKRKQRFEEVSLSRVYMMEMMRAEPEPEYDIRTVARVANLGTDLATLLREAEGWEPKKLAG